MSTAKNTSGLLVLAVDDEYPGLDQLTYGLENNPYVGRVITAMDASEALRLLSSEDPQVLDRRARGLPPVDAVFADLDMPGLSGLEMSQVFAALNPSPILVFVTGHERAAVNAFDLGAVDYVLKPYHEERLDKAVERVTEKLQATRDGIGPSASKPDQDQEEVILVELGGVRKLVPRSTIRWVEAQGDYARLFTSDGSHLLRTPLAQLEERWKDCGFVRIHRSYLVSLPLITELRMSQGGYQVVIGKEEKLLPVSRRHTRELKDRLVNASRRR